MFKRLTILWLASAPLAGGAGRDERGQLSAQAVRPV